MTAPTIEEYEARLAERVAQWEAQNPEQAAQLRVAVRREAGYGDAKPVTPFFGMLIQRAYHEKVRELKGWPTLRQWTKTQ